MNHYAFIYNNKFIVLDSTQIKNNYNILSEIPIDYITSAIKENKQELIEGYNKYLESPCASENDVQSFNEYLKSKELYDISHAVEIFMTAKYFYADEIEASECLYHINKRINYPDEYYVNEMTNLKGHHEKWYIQNCSS
jgi:hypothetical protein